MSTVVMGCDPHLDSIAAAVVDRSGTELAAVTVFATEPIEQMVLHEATRLPWGATLVLVTAIAHDELLAALLDLEQAGRRLVLFTLAKAPPPPISHRITVYHLPHLIEDIVAPTLIQSGEG